MTDTQNNSAFNIPVDSLVSGDITWKDYISSLSPEALEHQRQYDRARLRRWYQENKERKQEYCKEYYENNKEKRKENSRTYYQKNKERLAERQQCDICGHSYQLANRSVHNKTKKHQEAMKQKNETPLA